MLSTKLKKLATKFEGKSLFEYPVEKQKSYINKFREPRSNIERSYFQYKAQMKLKGWFLSLCVNIASIPLFFGYLFKPSKKKLEKKNADAVFVKDGGVNDNILPAVLVREFETLEYKAIEGNLLYWKDRWYLFKLILKHPFSWHFALKSTIKVMRYRWFIELYQPKALIVHNEYSFTSSLLTDFCNRNNVELINVMHGEKLFFMRDSFFKFNRCYVWNEFYKELLIELRADPEQFIVAVPPSLIFKDKLDTKEVDYTYYLQDQSGEWLKFIVDSMKKLGEKGCAVFIRPHPRYTNIEELKELVGDSGILIENCKDLSIEHSILRTKNVISIYSTVLQQAYFNGTNAVIDDVSNRELVETLKKLKYCMLNEKHQLISDILPMLQNCHKATD